MTTHSRARKEVKRKGGGGGFSIVPGLCDISDCKHIVSSLEEYLHVLTHLFPSLHLIISVAGDTYTASSAE